MKLWEGQRFLGSIDLDSDVRATETVELLVDPPDLEIRGAERRFVELYRLRDGSVVIREVDVERIPSKAALLSKDEAIGWFTAKGYDVPSVVSGEPQSGLAGTQSQSKRPEFRSTPKCNALDLAVEYTQFDIDSLVQLQKALLSFYRSSLCEFGCSELYPNAIGELSAFAIRAPKRVIDSAARVPGQSAVWLVMMGGFVIDECQFLGIDSFAEWLQALHLRRSIKIGPFESLGGWITDCFYRVACRREDPSCKDLNSDVPFEVAEEVVGEFQIRVPEMDTVTAVLAAARGAAIVVERGFTVGTTDLGDVPFPAVETIQNMIEETGPVDQTNYSVATSACADDLPKNEREQPEPAFPSVDEVAAMVSPRRRRAAFYRDFHWHQLARIDGLSVAEIRDAWNSSLAEGRYRIAKSKKHSEALPDGGAGWDRVSKGIIAADRDLETFSRKISET
ncbi:MAG: hypothetical protein HQ518_00645 [Rhodopirellula sp.]|nr:hypothetical protein [Rhodopirellula sp.]